MTFHGAPNPRPRAPCGIMSRMQKKNPAPFEAAPLDPYAERITTGIAMVGGVLMLPALFWFLSGIVIYGVAIPGIAISSATGVAMATWLTLNYAVQPTSYELRGDQLLIHRRWARDRRIPLRDILGVSPAPALADVPRRGLRQSFNAGVFGYHGPFQLEQYGNVFFSATDRARLVAIALRDKLPLIVSPHRPRDFTEALREALIQQAETEAATRDRSSGPAAPPSAA
jgi:Bacterial PH domain